MLYYSLEIFESYIKEYKFFWVQEKGITVLQRYSTLNLKKTTKKFNVS